MGGGEVEYSIYIVIDLWDLGSVTWWIGYVDAGR